MLKFLTGVVVGAVVTILLAVASEWDRNTQEIKRGER